MGQHRRDPASDRCPLRRTHPRPHSARRPKAAGWVLAEVATEMMADLVWNRWRLLSGIRTGHQPGPLPTFMSVSSVRPYRGVVSDRSSGSMWWVGHLGTDEQVRLFRIGRRFLPFSDS